MNYLLLDLDWASYWIHLEGIWTTARVHAVDIASLMQPNNFKSLPPFQTSQEKEEN